MTFSITLDGNNISDYIQDAGKVPFMEFTRAMEPIISSVNLTISGACPYTISIDSVVAFYQNGSLCFYGLVKNKVYDYDTATFEIMVESKLTVLRDKLIDKTVMGDITGYLYGGNFKPTLLMKCYFEKCGLTLDTSLIDSLNINVVYMFITVRSGLKMSSTKSISINNILKRPETLFAINQPYAADAVFIDADPDAKSNKITFWDHFCRMCSYFNVVPMLTGANSYKMVQAGSISITDDDSYIKKSSIDYSKNAADGVSVKASWTDITSNFIMPYLDASASHQISNQVILEDSGSGRTMLPWYNNEIWYMLQSTIQNPLGDNNTMYFVCPGVRYNSLVQNYLNEATKNFIVDTITGPARFDNVAVRGNLIDLDRVESEITQETIL